MANLDSKRGESTTVLASAARTATPTIDTFQVRGQANGLIVVINVTAIASTPSVVFTIKGVDTLSAATWDILASAAVTGTGNTVLRVSPHLTAAANTIAKDLVPSAFTVAAVHGNADSITYTIAAQVV